MVRQLKFAYPVTIGVLLMGVVAPLHADGLPAADSEPFPGVRYVHRHVSAPRELDMHVVIVDLNHPGVRVVTTGPNEDPGSETDIETTRQFAERTGAQIAINGGFFAYTKEAVKTRRTDLCSLAVSDGVRVSPWGHNQRDAVNIGADNRVTFIRQAADDGAGYMSTPAVELYNAIAGNVRLIENGVILAKGGNPTYPQTAVGCTADHRLILFVSDGRQPGFSDGMTYEELAHVLKEFGAVDAIALDGGGSATLVMADRNGPPRVLNRPSDGSERGVGNNLGVIVPDARGGTSEVIVVTACKLARPLQAVPGAVTVRSGEELAAGGAKDSRDASRAVPNLTLGEFTARRLAFPYVRGLGSGQNAPAVVTCIDGVPQLSYGTANQELLDVERVECLRGPQGAIHGAGTLGGVINIVPRLPSGEPSRSVTLSAGDHGAREGRLAVEGPLGGGLLGSVSGGYAARDGYTRNDVTGNALDDREAWFGRAQGYLPGQGPWDFRLSLTAQRDRDGDFALYDLERVRANPHHASHDYEGYADRDLAQPVFTAHRRGEAAEFTSITAFQWWQTEAGTDLDYTPADLLRKEARETYDAWIQEVRLASPSEAPLRLGDRVGLRWLTGVFAFGERYTQSAATEYRPGGIALGLWPDVFRMDTEAGLDGLGVGVFGQTIFTLDERWELGLGARDDFAHRSAELSGSTPSGPTSAPVDASRDFNHVSPRTSLGYRFTPGVMAYAGVSEGYRAGGFNAVAPPGGTSYDEETAWNYETGLKTGWLEERVTANVALFQADWRDLQVNTPVPGGNVSDYYVRNAGKARTRGAELELSARPVRSLELFGGVGLLDAEYQSGSESAGVDVGGNALPFAPRVNWHAGSQVTGGVGPRREVFARLEVVGVGRYYYDPSNREAQEAHALAHVRLGLVAGSWRVEGWVKNLFDQDYVPLAIPYGQDMQGKPLYVGESGDPRTVGVSLARRF
jgi:iron complex outermembrane receptor protein